ncbi:MAG: hypothetical protein AAF604_14920 [Acidobacteriota bacterium]
MIARRLYLSFLTLIVTAVLAFSLAAAPKADVKPRQGEWRATGTDECPQGTICAEWYDLTTGPAVRTGFNCCIVPKKIGSGDFWACAGPRPDDAPEE